MEKLVPMIVVVMVDVLKVFVNVMQATLPTIAQKRKVDVNQTDFAPTYYRP